MVRTFVFLFLFSFIFIACNNNQEEEHKTDSTNKIVQPSETEKTNTKKDNFENQVKIKSDSTLQLVEENLDFSQTGFDDKIFYELLIETHLCDPNYGDSSKNTTPCSAQFFKFFEYNHKRNIEDAFMLQVKAGVNNYPYRRLLLFVRENGKLILMNGVVGYLVQRISQENGIDDLVVAVIDDLGNNQFDRYDVLLQYRDGKYHFKEAIGDLQGVFDSPELKEKATAAISQRISEKELIF